MLTLVTENEIWHYRNNHHYYYCCLLCLTSFVDEKGGIWQLDGTRIRIDSTGVCVKDYNQDPELWDLNGVSK